MSILVSGNAEQVQGTERCKSRIQGCRSTTDVGISARIQVRVYVQARDEPIPIYQHKIRFRHHSIVKPKTEKGSRERRTENGAL